jgi:hypothetical protein
MNRRWLVVLLWALPTLIVGGVWIYSGVKSGRRVLTFNPPPWEVRLSKNYLNFEWSDPPVPTSTVNLPSHWQNNPPPNGAFGRSRAGGQYFFGWLSLGEMGQIRGPQTVMTRHVRVTLAIPFLLTMPTLWMAYRAWQRGSLEDQRRFAGLCPRCGYDVRATPQRCPECGAILTPAAARPA